MAWRWTARRWAISAFVLFHLSALVMWTMPPCGIKTQFQSPYRYYVLPLGLWQWWAIFAPDPIRINRPERRGGRRQGDAARLRVPPARRPDVVAEVPPLPQLQVHGQHAVRGVQDAPRRSRRGTRSGSSAWARRRSRSGSASSSSSRTRRRPGRGRPTRWPRRSSSCWIASSSRRMKEVRP